MNTFKPKLEYVNKSIHHAENGNRCTIGKITRYTYLCKLVFQSRVSNLLHRNLLQGRKSLFIINFIFRVTVYDGLLQPAVQAFSSDAQMFLLSKASFVTIENVKNNLFCKHTKAFKAHGPMSRRVDQAHYGILAPIYSAWGTCGYS